MKKDKKVILSEEQLWCRYGYMLHAEKHNYKVTFVTEEGEFVASFKPATRASKGIPHYSISAKFSQRFYKEEGLRIPSSLKEMRQILKEKKERNIKGIY